jgi:hypothetical protein
MPLLSVSSIFSIGRHALTVEPVGDDVMSGAVPAICLIDKIPIQYD